MKAEVSLKVTIDYEGDIDGIKDAIKWKAERMNICGASKNGHYNFTVDKVEVE